MKDAEFIRRLNEIPNGNIERQRECHMASLVGVFAASHGPMIAREWDSLSPPTRASRRAEVSARSASGMMAARPDVLIIVSPDHWVNFFLNNFPAFCVGVGAEHDGPPEPFLKKVFIIRRWPGTPASAITS